MKTVNVKLKQIKVLKFDPREHIITFSILYNDGGADFVYKKMVKNANPEELTSKVMSNFRKELKLKHASAGDYDPLSGIVNIHFVCDDLDTMIDRIKKFFLSIDNVVSSGKLAKISYADMEKKITGISVIF